MIRRESISRFRWYLIISACAVGFTTGVALAYPPAVGILSPAKNCLSCHANNGPWKDDSTLIIDILDKQNGQSLKQKDGTFLIAAHQGEARTVVTVIGTVREAQTAHPYRNAWLYIDPRRITDSTVLDKFAAGWDVNLPMACRIVGDASQEYPGARVTVLPMTVRPGADAKDTMVQLQVMLTRGESVKGKAKEGMTGSYFERTVRLRVLVSPPREGGSLDRSPSPPGKPENGQRDFQLLDAYGREFKLSEALLQGAVALWFTNLCPGCQTGIPTLNALAGKLADRQIKIAAISLLGSDRQTLLDATQNLTMAFPVLIDPDGEVSEEFTGVRSTTVCPAQNFFIVSKAGETVFAGHFPGTQAGEIETELDKTLR